MSASAATRLLKRTPQKATIAATSFAPDAVMADPDLAVPTPDARVAPPADAAVPEPDAARMPDAAAPPPPVPPGDAPGNVGFVGSSCAADADCTYDGGVCLAAAGYPNGMCTQACDRLCPDRDGASTTFCLGDVLPDGGACVQQCDFAAFPTGCRPGYGCRTLGRFNEPATERQVCLPGEGEPLPDDSCMADLAQRRVGYLLSSNPGDHPAGHPELTCDIDGPILLESPVGGIEYRYIENDAPSAMFMSCQLAVAIDDLSTYLRELDVVEVAHIGTYNCRLIEGTNELSTHGLGTALDIAQLTTRDGTTYNVERDWEVGVDPPQTAAGRFLYEVAHQMYERRIFNIVLTPEYNAAHYNHFHVDLTPDAHFLGFAPGLPPWPSRPAGDD